MTTDRGEFAEPWAIERNRIRRVLSFLLLAFSAGVAVSFIACHSRKSELAPHYHLTGKISDVDRSGKYVLVQQDDIPGFMPAMMMSYPVEDAYILDKLSAGDQISADVVVGNDGARLENIAIVKKGSGEGARPSS